ncbi:uncharacterized protein EDB91DRAFT_1062050, partial [Suillus paluster]|uniref:uncharacterized protein n=1 Tax=Suillus paluster TaxID=48578 RepID=UPI001B878C24
PYQNFTIHVPSNLMGNALLTVTHVALIGVRARHHDHFVPTKWELPASVPGWAHYVDGGKD